MIRFGPAGIPLSCKGRTMKDGVEDVHYLDLGAIELQLVRGVNMDKLPEYEEVGVMAAELDIRLSLHTPYYMDLLNDVRLVHTSMEMLKNVGVVAKVMDADLIVTHIGPYGNIPVAEATDKVVRNIREIRDYYLDNGIRARMGLENSGRAEVFGTMGEILSVCNRVKNIIPVINFSHIHARGNGCLRRKEDFQLVFDNINDALSPSSFYAHYSGVSYRDGDELHYIPLKKSDTKFDYLAECVLRNDYDITLISDSPLMEHDAMYMKVIMERVHHKRLEKRAKTLAQGPGKQRIGKTVKN